MKKLGQKVRALRKRQLLTQTQLAQMLEVDQSYIVKIEKGERTPGLEILIKLTQVFNVTSDQLIMDDQELNG